MDEKEQVQSIIEILKELQEDGSVPRNVKEKLTATIKSLDEDKDISIKVNKALHELEEIADDPNLQTYARTQIWNIVSLLEKLH
ncbi:hypothetical protein GOV06_05690 [Candidatus Woesearchaeota archaeon]|nr:hypothetical protein [Candidatus Woesearchaeota archaeon]